MYFFSPLSISVADNAVLTREIDIFVMVASF